jgi:hypothetical protein
MHDMKPKKVNIAWAIIASIITFTMIFATASLGF